MQQFTSVDAQFIAAEDGCVRGHVVGVAIYDASRRKAGPLTTADVRELLARRIHLIEPFRRRMVGVPLGLDLPYWIEDPQFDLRDHVVERRLPAAAGAAELAAAAAEILATPLDLTKPPWQIHVIHGLPGDRVAIATAIHHAASDGIGMAEMFAILHDPSPSERDLGAGEATVPARIPGRLEMLARGLAGIPRQPMRLAGSLPRALPHLDQVVTLRPMPGVPTIARLGRRAASLLPAAPDDGDFLDQVATLAPRTRTTGRVSPRRTVAFTTTRLEEIKQIKNHFAVSVNDVVMAIVAGGLRAWLERHDDLPDAPLAAMVPISVRPTSPSTPREAFGNRIAMMVPPVFTDEPDPVVRLRRTHAAMRSAKERHRAVPATLLQDANHFVPPVLLARAARAGALVSTSRFRGAAANVLISNIPGARDSQYLAGARLEAHFPLSAIFHGLGLNVTIVSYGDQIDWGIVGDPEQIDDAWGLAEQIVAAQAELLEVAVATAVVA